MKISNRIYEIMILETFGKIYEVSADAPLLEWTRNEDTSLDDQI
jgi:hypothetical protein